MFPLMPPANSRKRAAPGASPAMAQQIQQQQSYVPTTQPWDDSNNATLFSDPNTFNLSNFSGSNNSQQPNSQFQHNSQGQAPSTQLARRPIQNRQMVQAGTRPYDGLNAPWGTFGEGDMLDPQGGPLEETDNVDVLEERAVIAKRDAQTKRKQIPPFVQKLSSFLDESKNTELIRWSDRGDSFIVLDEDEFAKTLIPELFKHNNYASFVRQLNMYGFHKRVGLSDNSMKASERKNKSPSEYSNPYFRRGHPNLLWLINKPKGGTGQKKAKRGKTEDGDGGSDDDGNDVEAIYSNDYGGHSMQNSRAISAAPESGPLQRREMAVVQNQLQDIQKQQAAISNAISRLRKDHNQLYQQAVAFQTLHDRHENSINAILTFLATVYNRSLDGQGPQNMAQMFANIIPQAPNQQGNVVDMSDMSQVPNQQQQMQPGSVSPMRRQQRLLMAPPTGGQTSNATSPSISNMRTPTPISNNYNTSSGAIEELFDSSDSPQIKTESTPPVDTNSQHDMLNLINNTNASSSSSSHPSGSGANALNFPDVLSHYETANGGSPLTSAQRNDMLSLIANQTAANGPGNSNNALISPTPPPRPDLDALGYTSKELDELMRMQAEQDSRLKEVHNYVRPLSPGGVVPGVDIDMDPYGSNGNGYFGSTSGSGNNNLDLDQFLDDGAYYANGDGGTSGTGDGTFTFDDVADPGDFDFGIGSSGVGDLGSGADFDGENGTRIVEEAETPDGGATPKAGEDGSPNSKKRRRA